MKRLVVNAFCPGEHKVISSLADRGPAATRYCSQSRRHLSLRSRFKIREVRTAFADKFGHFGLWLSLVERLVRDQEAVGSNPTSPISTNCGRRAVTTATGRGFKSHQPDFNQLRLCSGRRGQRQFLQVPPIQGSGCFIATLRGFLREFGRPYSPSQRWRVEGNKHRVPWALIQSEGFATRIEAAQRERYYKTGRGRDELDRLRQSGRRGDRPWVQIPPAR